MESPESDLKLLDRYKTTGDNQWLGILLERYTTSLFLYCMKHLESKQEAQDVVQQVQINVLMAVDKVRIENFQAWLYTIARNECFTQFRQKRRLLRKLGRADGHPISEQAVEPSAFASAEADNLRMTLLSDAFKKLPASQQVCLRLFYLLDKSYQNIADETGYTLKEVKSNIQNGKRNLKTIIEQKTP
jgi:RNA polymerase sigma-70 factor (ECF subfamily)